MFETKHGSQFLVQSCLATRLKVADDDAQLSNVLDKFLQMLLQIVKFFSHYD